MPKHEHAGAAQVIANYEQLATLTEEMRKAAAQEEWERLIEIERQCSMLVSEMKSVDAEVKLDKAAQQHKFELINKILADEAVIRNHTQTWMDQLKSLIQSNRQEQRLHKAYGA